MIPMIDTLYTILYKCYTILYTRYTKYFKVYTNIYQDNIQNTRRRRAQGRMYIYICSRVQGSGPPPSPHRVRSGFQGGFLWISLRNMVSYGFLWFPMDSYGFLWIPMVWKWYGLPMDSYGFLWIPMTSYRFLWISMVSLCNKTIWKHIKMLQKHKKTNSNQPQHTTHRFF